MTARLIDDRRERRAALVREITSIDVDQAYFAVTVTGDDDTWRLSVQSHFAGWPEGSGLDRGIELREGSLVDPYAMTSIWSDIGQRWIVVSKPEHLAFLLRVGGNALVVETVARTYLGRWVEPHEVVHDGPFGFRRYDPDAREVRCKAPTKKQRFRVLERDGFRCQTCGERPSDNEHITLHVHHVRPFSRGGITIDENLITLCQTCHDGLDPHEDLLLYWLPGGHADRALAEMSTAAFETGVQAYRERTRALLG